MRYKWLPPHPGHVLTVNGSTRVLGDEFEASEPLTHPWLVAIAESVVEPEAEMVLDVFAMIEEGITPKKKAKKAKKAEVPVEL